MKNIEIMFAYNVNDLYGMVNETIEDWQATGYKLVDQQMRTNTVREETRTTVMLTFEKVNE